VVGFQAPLHPRRKVSFAEISNLEFLGNLKIHKAWGVGGKIEFQN